MVEAQVGDDSGDEGASGGPDVEVSETSEVEAPTLPRPSPRLVGEHWRSTSSNSRRRSGSRVLPEDRGPGKGLGGRTEDRRPGPSTTRGSRREGDHSTQSRTLVPPFPWTLRVEPHLLAPGPLIPSKRDPTRLLGSSGETVPNPVSYPQDFAPLIDVTRCPLS